MYACVRMDRKETLSGGKWRECLVNLNDDSDSIQSFENTQSFEEPIISTPEMTSWNVSPNALKPRFNSTTSKPSTIERI